MRRPLREFIRWAWLVYWWIVICWHDDEPTPWEYAPRVYLRYTRRFGVVRDSGAHRAIQRALVRPRRGSRASA